MTWFSPISFEKEAYYRSIPKVDLHRHLEGSLRLSTLVEIADRCQIPIAAQEIQSRVEVRPGDPLTIQNFLGKFQALRQFYRSPEIICQITEEAIADAAMDGVVYLELRFTPAALSSRFGCSLSEVMDWVAGAAEQASQRYSLVTRLIASVNRHEPVEIAEKVAALAAERIERGIVGLDLAGDEAKYSCLPFAGVFHTARESGLHITVHAGEWGGPENIQAAVASLHAERIGHGIRILEDAGVVAMVRERRILLEVCVGSNYLSGVVPSIGAHPFPELLREGLVVTINTDDPSIQGEKLSDEFHFLADDLQMPLSSILRCQKAALRSSFLPEIEVQKLEQKFSPVWENLLKAS